MTKKSVIYFFLLLLAKDTKEKLDLQTENACYSKQKKTNKKVQTINNV